MNCKAKTQSGKPCSMAAIKGGRYCFTHSPQLGKIRAEAHARGGQRARIPHVGNAEAITTQPRTIQEAMTILDYALAEVIAQENSIQRGRLLVAIAAGYVDAVKVGEIEPRLAALEAALRMREERQ